MFLIFPQNFNTMLRAIANVGVEYTDDFFYTTKYRWDNAERINAPIQLLPQYIDVVEKIHYKMPIVVITKEGHYISGSMFYKADIVLHYRNNNIFTIMRDQFDITNDETIRYTIREIETILTSYTLGKVKQ